MHANIHPQADNCNQELIAKPKKFFKLILWVGNRLFTNTKTYNLLDFQAFETDWHFLFFLFPTFRIIASTQTLVNQLLFGLLLGFWENNHVLENNKLKLTFFT